MATRRQVKIFINGKEVENTIRSITSEKRKLNNELRNMVVGSEEYINASKELKRVNGILTDHRNGLRDVETSWQKLTKGGITKLAGLAAGAFAVENIAQYGAELFKLGAEMEVLGRKAQTVFGEVLPQVTREAERNAQAMGLTTSQYIDAAAAIGDLLIPMGFQREEAADISTELVNLSGALSEWTGGQIDAENVTRILGKAILGEREELKQLGISIQEADVKARLAEKGLSNLTGEMLQQAKAAATLELITEKSVDAQTAYIDNADTLVRQQAELRAQIQEVSERLATALLPVFRRLVDIALAAARGLENLTGLFGGVSAQADQATQAFDQQSAKVADLERNLSPLINRYDELSSQTQLSEAEQQELKDIIEEVAQTVPSAVTEFDKYGKALDINSDKAREFVKVQQALLAEKNRDAIQAQQDKLSDLQEEYNGLSNVVTETDGAFQKFFKQDGEFFERVIKGGKTTRTELRKLSEEEVAGLVNRFGQLAQRIEGTQALINQLSGQPIVEDIADSESSGGLSPTPDQLDKQRAAAEKLREQRISQLEKLQAALEAFREEERLSDLSADEQALERLRLRYQKQIDLALQLEQAGSDQAFEARVALEQLRDQQLLQLRLEQNAARMQAEDEQRQQLEEQRIQKEQEYEQARAEAIRTIQEATRQTVLDDQQIALIELSEYYDELRALAEQYGMDVVDIDIAYRRERARIQEDFQQQSLQSAVEAQKQEAEILATAFAGVANVAGGALDALGQKSKENAALTKILTLAQIGFSTASGIAKAVAASAGQPFPANLVAITSSVAAVLSAIGQAKSALSEVPPLPQFYKGRWTNARGADDGRVYHAQYIGSPGTGMLPKHPVLMDTLGSGRVLASERGNEYFVSNKALQNPQVLNYVKAIDNITRNRQFVDGGFTAAASPVGVAPGAADVNTDALNNAAKDLSAAVAGLQQLLAVGIFARIDDDTIIDLRNRQNTLVNASGGII